MISSFNNIDVDPAANFVGTCDVTVRVTDQGGLTDDDTFTITVTEDAGNDGKEEPPNRGSNNVPYFTSVPVTEALADEKYVYDVTAFDPDGDSLTYTLVLGPEGMRINSGNGLIL